MAKVFVSLSIFALGFLAMELRADSPSPNAAASHCGPVNRDCQSIPGAINTINNCNKLENDLSALQQMEAATNGQWPDVKASGNDAQAAVMGTSADAEEAKASAATAIEKLNRLNASATECMTQADALMTLAERFKTQINQGPLTPSQQTCAKASSAAANSIKKAASEVKGQCAVHSANAKQSAMNWGSILKTAGLLAAGAGLGYMLSSLLGGNGSKAKGGNDKVDVPNLDEARLDSSVSCPVNTVLKNGICVVDSPDDAQCEANEELKADGKCYVITDQSRCGNGAKWDTARKVCVLASDGGKPVNIGDPEAVTSGDGTTAGFASGTDNKKDPFAPDGSANLNAASSARGMRNNIDSSGGAPDVRSGRGFASFQASGDGGPNGSSYRGAGFGGGAGADGKEGGQDAQNTLNYLKWKNPAQSKSLEERMREKY
jgi:hypothetical protein